MRPHAAISLAGRMLQQHSSRVNTGIWQSIDVSNKPDMETMEVLNHTVQFDANNLSLDNLKYQIKPNLPWADDHFLERVCGFPLNPGKEWKNWPWANSANSFRDENGQFNHSYMERYYPQYAGQTEDNDYYEKEQIPRTSASGMPKNVGIRERYGDLDDIINHLAEHPHTRQAYMPIFFPEDTGVSHGGRVPCSLGYHFILRDNRFHCIYYLRSCDFYRHFRDDIYLTVRLQMWILGKLWLLSNQWEEVEMGEFTMHITSLHCFVNDYRILFPDKNGSN